MPEWLHYHQMKEARNRTELIFDPLAASGYFSFQNMTELAGATTISMP